MSQNSLKMLPCTENAIINIWWTFQESIFNNFGNTIKYQKSINRNSIIYNLILNIRISIVFLFF